VITCELPGVTYRLEKEASVFSDWDEPKSIFIEFLSRFDGTQEFLCLDFLIENSSEITVEWTKKFTQNINRIKDSMRSEGASGFEGSFSMNNPTGSVSLAQQFKFNIEASRKMAINTNAGTEGTQGNAKPAPHTAFAEVTNVTDQPIDYLGGFADLVRPLADQYDPQRYGHYVLSCNRDDSSMTKELTRLFLASGVEVDFIMRYETDEDRTLFEIVWKGQLVLSQQVELEIGSLSPGAILLQADGAWKEELVQLFQELEKIASKPT
jgi:hypothetical protein